MQLSTAINIVQKAMNERKALALMEDVLKEVRQAEVRVAELKKTQEAIEGAKSAAQAEFEKECKGRNKEIKRLDDLIASAHNQLSSLNKKIKKRNADMLEDVASAEAQLNEIKVETEDAVNTASRELEDIYLKVAEQEKRLASIEKKIAELKGM